MESSDVVLEVFLHFGDISFQVDSVRNQCNKNIQKLMEEMHFLEMVSTRELMFCLILMKIRSKSCLLHGDTSCVQLHIVIRVALFFFFFW